MSALFALVGRSSLPRGAPLQGPVDVVCVVLCFLILSHIVMFSVYIPTAPRMLYFLLSYLYHRPLSYLLRELVNVGPLTWSEAHTGLLGVTSLFLVVRTSRTMSILWLAQRTRSQ